MNSPSHTPTYQSVDYLRGLAAMGVVLFHVRVDLWVGWYAIRSGGGASSWEKSTAWLSILTPFMGSGVFLFFLLSGFCIALPYAGPKARAFHFRSYLSRRLWRIYPPYLVVILFGWSSERICSWIDGQAVSPPRTGLSSILMVQNYSTGQMVSNPSLWSLPVEMELYLIFPLVYWLLRHWGTRILMLVAAAVSCMALVFHSMGATWVTGNFAKYWLIWCAGAVLAEWSQTGRLRSPSSTVLSLGALSFLVAVFGTAAGWGAAYLQMAYGAGFFVLLWFALANDHLWLKLPALALRALAFLGTISYSLYLTHFPFFRLVGTFWTKTFGGKPMDFLIPLMFAGLSVVVGWLFYRLVEAPSHRLAKTLSGSPNRNQASALSK
jgi:peptidoglycan/LPS O-acetylase OafA/YrhL